MNRKQMGVPVLAVVAMLFAGASLAFASTSSPIPDCGERIDYYSDKSHTEQVGMQAREPEDPCNCDGYWAWGTTTPFYTVNQQVWCF